MREISEITQIPSDGEKQTARLFRGIGYVDADQFLGMHDPDARAEASAFYLEESGDKVEDAIESGRRPPGKGRLGRGRETSAFQDGLERRLTSRVGPVEASLIADEVARKTGRPFFEQVGEGID